MCVVCSCSQSVVRFCKQVFSCRTKLGCSRVFFGDMLDNHFERQSLLFPRDQKHWNLLVNLDCQLTIVNKINQPFNLSKKQLFSPPMFYSNSLPRYTDCFMNNNKTPTWKQSTPLIHNKYTRGRSHKCSLGQGEYLFVVRAGVLGCQHSLDDAADLQLLLHAGVLVLDHVVQLLEPLQHFGVAQLGAVDLWGRDRVQWLMLV